MRRCNAIQTSAEYSLLLRVSAHFVCPQKEAPFHRISFHFSVRPHDDNVIIQMKEFRYRNADPGMVSFWESLNFTPSSTFDIAAEKEMNCIVNENPLHCRYHQGPPSWFIRSHSRHCIRTWT